MVCQGTEQMSTALPAVTTDLAKFDMLHLKIGIIIPNWYGSSAAQRGRARLCNFMIYHVNVIFSPRSSKWELLQFILIQIKQLSQKKKKKKERKKKKQRFMKGQKGKKKVKLHKIRLSLTALQSV